MAGFKSIKDAIVTVLQGVSSLEVVYGKDAKALEAFPAATVSAKEHTSEYHTMGLGGANKNVYQHYVRVYFPTDERDDADYEDVLTQVADDVLTALAHNVTLNGSCDYSIPASSQWMVGNEEVPTRMIEIVVESTVHAIR